MKLTSFKSTSIAFLPPSFLTLDFTILHTNIETDDTILDKNQSSTLIEKENSSSCDEYRSLIIDIGRTKDSYSVSRSLSLKKNLVNTFDKHITVATTDPSSPLSSSLKSSKKKLNKLTRSIVKANINAFDRTSIECPTSCNQRSRVDNISQIPQHISQPPVARLSKTDDNVSSTACIVGIFLKNSSTSC